MSYEVLTEKLNLRALGHAVLRQPGNLGLGVLVFGLYSAYWWLLPWMLRDILPPLYPLKFILDFILGLGVLFVTILLKTRVIEGNGHRRLVVRSPWLVLFQQIRWVAPCFLIAFGAFLIGLIPLIFVTRGVEAFSQTMPWAIPAITLAIAPILVPYLFVGEVALFGLADRGKEALRISKVIVQKNWGLALLVYVLSWVVPGLPWAQGPVGPILSALNTLLSAFLLVLWTTIMGTSLKISETVQSAQE